MEIDLRRRGRSRSFLLLFTLAVQCFLVNLSVFGLSGDVEFEYSVFTMIGFGMLLHRLYCRGEGVDASDGARSPSGGRDFESRAPARIGPASGPA